jgi:DNA-binding SARP family transcriptional activator
LYSLRVVGGLQLRGPSGPVTGRATHRRPLALLAVLAVAGERGATRDQLAGLLWGETDDHRALSELSNALYLIHRELGPNAVVSQATQLRLDAAAVDSDIRAFRAALERRDGAAAVMVMPAEGGDPRRVYDVTPTAPPAKANR